MTPLHSHFEAKKHIIWDWNGTLLRDLEHAVDTVNRLLVEEGLKPLSVEQYRERFGFPVIEYYRELGLPTDPKAFFELCERFNRYFHDGVDRCTIWPGARETLTYVKACGKVQSILSASEQNLLREQVCNFKLEDLFDHVTGIADKMAGSKVERGQELMRAVGIPAEHTLLIGDTIHDCEVGQALGIDVILVDHGHQSASRLRGAHHHVVKVY